MVKKETCACPAHGKGSRVLLGIVALLLGISLWVGYFDLTQTIAIILIFIGIKKVLPCCSCSC